MSNGAKRVTQSSRTYLNFIDLDGFNREVYFEVTRPRISGLQLHTHVMKDIFQTLHDVVCLQQYLFEINDMEKRQFHHLMEINYITKVITLSILVIIIMSPNSYTCMTCGP